MSAEVSFKDCTKLEIWIPGGKARAQPKRNIIQALQLQPGKKGEKNAYHRLNELIREYERITGKIVCYDEYGSLYFAKDEEELGEFLTRARNTERKIADGKLAEIQSYEDRGFWPDPQALHEDRTVIMLKDHDLTIPTLYSMKQLEKRIKDLEKEVEELRAAEEQKGK